MACATELSKIIADSPALLPRAQAALELTKGLPKSMHSRCCAEFNLESEKRKTTQHFKWRGDL